MSCIGPKDELVRPTQVGLELGLRNMGIVGGLELFRCALWLKPKSLRFCTKQVQLLHHIAYFIVGYITTWVKFTKVNQVLQLLYEKLLENCHREVGESQACLYCIFLLHIFCLCYIFISLLFLKFQCLTNNLKITSDVWLLLYVDYSQQEVTYK